MLTGALGKIATDVMLLMQSEVDEVREPYQKGRGGSSTMPQKRNPIACELILAAAKNVRQLVPVMLDALLADHERATGAWHAEWIALPQAFALTGGALHHARATLEGLEVDPARMRRNLDLTRGLISAEAVMMALAPFVGRAAGASPGRRRLPQRAGAGPAPARRPVRRAGGDGAPFARAACTPCSIRPARPASPARSSTGSSTGTREAPAVRAAAAGARCGRRPSDRRPR